MYRAQSVVRDHCRLLQRPLVSRLNRAVLRETAVEITFEVDGSPIKFSRNWFTGRCTLDTGTKDEALQSPWNPFTHFSFKSRRRWQCSIKGHEVVIEMDRPSLFAGVRSQTYRIFIDGRLVQEQNGF
jgi:hypothetical protein